MVRPEVGNRRVRREHVVHGSVTGPVAAELLRHLVRHSIRAIQMERIVADASGAVSLIIQMLLQTDSLVHRRVGHHLVVARANLAGGAHVAGEQRVAMPFIVDSLAHAIGALDSEWTVARQIIVNRWHCVLLVSLGREVGIVARELSAGSGRVAQLGGHELFAVWTAHACC